MPKTSAERQREYRERNREKALQQRRELRQRNITTVREKEAEYARRRRRELGLLAPPTYVCADCQETFERSSKGPIPLRCPECREKRNRELRRGRERIYSARPHRVEKRAAKIKNRTPEQKAAAAVTTREWARRVLPVRRRQAMELLGGVVCKHCGITDERVLTFDHVGGGGGQERALLGASYVGQRIVREILADPEAGREKFRVLCFNCNWIAHLELKAAAGDS